MSTRGRVKLIRWMRAFMVVPMIPNVLFGILAAIGGNPDGFASAATVLFLALVMIFQTFVIMRLDPAGEYRLTPVQTPLRRITGRRCPDYAAIAGMERDIWGEAFRHDGAPERDKGRRTTDQVIAEARKAIAADRAARARMLREAEAAQRIIARYEWDKAEREDDRLRRQAGGGRR